MNKHLETQHGGSHYKDMKIQPMEFCLANMSAEELRGVLKFNVTKYVWRDKKNQMEDYQKARHYIDIITHELSSRGEEVPPLTDDIVTARKEDDCKCLFKFPTTKFAKVNDPTTQLRHLVSEAQEFIVEYDKWVLDSSMKTNKFMIMEAVDFVHSLDTYSKINAATKERVASAIEEVIEGNRERNYYTEE